MTKNIIIICAVVGLALVSCVNEKKSKSSVVIDHEFNSYFHLKGNGFTGGDGTYSVLLPDGRTVWIFGDTFIGAVNEDNTRTKTDPIYIRNSLIIQDGKSFEFVYNDTGKVNRSLMIPPQVLESNFKITEYQEWYWPGDGFVSNNELKIFASEFNQVDTSMWGFKWNGTALFSFSLPDLKRKDVELFDYGLKNGVHYGHAVLEDDEFLYIYGLCEGKPHVARVDIKDVSDNWEFFNGSSWSKNPEDSKPMADIHGSEQFSILKMKNKYYYVTQDGGLSPEIYVYNSKVPYSGWSIRTLLYTTPLDSLNKDIFTYNAVAHPQFVDERGILVSYNTNSFTLSDHYRDAGIYRPRFIRVPLDRMNE
ncbi:MAG: hypothetical protein C0597_11175 [Marinilabiliales bacterium]|nr:MAG: hypothetical protein C0597_11175 [Marinilabiliales bacterium]